MQTWLGSYVIGTPGVKSSTNVTVRMGPEDVVQPAGLLRTVETCGGRTRFDEAGYPLGPPEFVIDVAPSPASIDANTKKNSYLRTAVREYVLWRTVDGAERPLGVPHLCGMNGLGG